MQADVDSASPIFAEAQESAAKGRPGNRTERAQWPSPSLHQKSFSFTLE